jgi:hypothetical protein
MRRLSDDIKVNLAIMSTQISSSGSTSPYFSLKDYDRAMFVWEVTPLTAAGSISSSIGLIYQATDGSAGTSAAAVTGSTATVTYYTKATEFMIVPATLSAANSIAITGYDINGEALTALTFTAEDGGTSASTASTSRLFSINDTAAGTGIVSTAITNLAALINDATFGLPGAYATAAATTITIRGIDNDAMYSITSNNTKAMGMAEINASSLTLTSNFTHVALNVINAVSAWTSAFIIRRGRRAYKPVQTANVLTTIGE